MAEVGRRDVVGDPLALNPRAQAADRSVANMMVRNPGATAGKLDFSVADSLNNFGNAVVGVMKEKEEEFISEGKLRYMQGATEDEIAKTGNQWTMQGWQALNAADTANRWYADEMTALTNGAQQLSPEDYNKGMMDRRAQALSNLPDDPAIRKLYIAAFDDLGPRLASAQVAANNEWNKVQTQQAFTGLLESGSFTNADTPRQSADTPLMLSPGKVRPTISNYDESDIDLMTRAVLGEAAGEGATGQAAVAHNILNRVIDGGFGGHTIKGVVLKKGQYSALNAETGYLGGKGSNKLVNTDPNSVAFQRTRQIVQHVLSGHNVDPTNGSTHYVTNGLQPKWRKSIEAQAGVTVVGNHDFMGKARNLEGANIKPIDTGMEGGQEVEVTPYTDPQVVSVAAGIPNAQTISPAQTQAQATVRNFNMPAQQKATSVAQTMITQLGAGSSALWDSLGGVSFLQELKATPAEIRQAQTAYDKYEREKSNEFNLERAQWQASLTADITAGTKTLAEAEAEIQQRYDGKQLTDAQAYGLVNAATQASVASDRQPNMDPTLQRALANTYAAIRNDPDTYSPEWADGHIRWLANKYGMPPAQLQQRLAEAWQTEEQSKSAAITAARTAANKAAEREAKITEIDAALKVGSGLSNITGSVDGMPAQQFAVKRRWDELKLSAADAIPGYMKSGMTSLEAQRKAAATAETQLWKEMQAQGGVVYDALAGSITSGVSGNMVAAGGKVTDSAREAADTYLRLLEVDPTGSYASKYATTEQSRNALMLISKFYAGDLDLDSAIRKTNEFLSTGQDKPADITQTTGFTRKLEKNMRDNFDTLMGSPGWFGDSKVRMGDKAYSLNNENTSNQLRSAISARAWAYYANEPHLDPDIIMKKAAQDAVNDSVLVGGNILTPRSTGGTPMLDQMGLRWEDDKGNTKSYPQDAASAAFDMWIADYAEQRIADVEAGVPDATGWGKAYKQLRGGTGIFQSSDGTPNVFRDRNPVPPYYASWDQDSGTVMIQLWKDGSRKELADAQPIFVPAAAVGAFYKDKVAPTEPSFVQKAWVGLWSAIK